VYSTFGEAASWRRSSVYLLAGSVPGMMWEDTAGLTGRQAPGERAVAVPSHDMLPESMTEQMDIDAISVDVAAAVGLAEGEGGVRDVLVAIARGEPIATSQISRAAELPVPLVTAVCNELRKRGVIDRSRPVRLTELARGSLIPAGLRLDPVCDRCDGLGVTVPAELRPLAAELDVVAAGAPAARLELDQTHCTVETKIRRVLRMQQAGALDGRRIILLGDDDLIAVTIARFGRVTGTAAAIGPITVVDADPAVLAWTGEQAAGQGVAVDLVEHDLRQPLPDAMAGQFDVACTDPPYTVPGAELFLSRAVSALRARPGQHVFFSFGARRPEESLRVQQLIAGLGLTIRSLTPNFNSYQGAGILAGSSHLYHLRSTAATAPAVSGAYSGPMYTADTRESQRRPYRCAGCGAVYQVGRAAAGQPPSAAAQIAQLQEAGCPACGGVTFRPMPRLAR
jgi:predicted methyltransferase